MCDFLLARLEGAAPAGATEALQADRATVIALLLGVGQKVWAQSIPADQSHGFRVLFHQKGVQQLAAHSLAGKDVGLFWPLINADK